MEIPTEIESELRYRVSRITGDATALKGVEILSAEDLIQKGFDRVSLVGEKKPVTRFTTSSATFSFPPNYVFAYTAHSVVALAGLTSEITALPFSHQELRTRQPNSQ